MCVTVNPDFLMITNNSAITYFIDYFFTLFISLRTLVSLILNKLFSVLFKRFQISFERYELTVYHVRKYYFETEIGYGFYDFKKIKLKFFIFVRSNIQKRKFKIKFLSK